MYTVDDSKFPVYSTVNGNFESTLYNTYMYAAPKGLKIALYCGLQFHHEKSFLKED